MTAWLSEDSWLDEECNPVASALEVGRLKPDTREWIAAHLGVPASNLLGYSRLDIVDGPFTRGFLREGAD